MASEISRAAAGALLTVPEVARVLRISRAQAYQLAQRGDLPGVVHIGRCVRVSADALQDWIDREAAHSPRRQ